MDRDTSFFKQRGFWIAIAVGLIPIGTYAALSVLWTR
jgi:hypothetical protein